MNGSRGLPVSPPAGSHRCVHCAQFVGAEGPDVHPHAQGLEFASGATFPAPSRSPLKCIHSLGLAIAVQASRASRGSRQESIPAAAG